jgi:glycosyltransferase involved in cell wall biosynthesis
MHILLFGPVPPPMGGVQAHMMALHDHLLSRGHRVSVINITRHRKKDGDGIYYPASATALLALVFKLSPDIMHVHLGGHLGRRDLALCLALSAIPGPSIFFTFHSGGYPSSEAGQRATPGSLPGMILRRLDGLIGVNAEIVDVFRRYGVDPSRTALIKPHSISEASLSHPPEAMPVTLRAFADCHHPFLLTVGGLEPEYSNELQIDAMPAIRQRHPGAGLAILGGGSLETSVRERIAASPVRDHILLCGDVPHSGTMAAIARTDLMLRPTQYDGDSVSVREALAMGTRVLASRTAMRPPGVMLLPSLEQEALVGGVSEALASDPPAIKGGRGEGNLEAVLDFYWTISGREATKASG